MKTFVAGLLLCLAVPCVAQQEQKQTPPTLKSVLLQQLRETHNEKNWFVSAKEAAGGITAEQATWSDGKNHSVGQLVHHLAFWNEHALAQFKGEKPAQVDDNNQTFQFEPKGWNATVQKLDDVMTQLENFVSSADDATLAKIAPTIARISQHNAYHIGEIVMVRKAQGSWNPDNGVK